MPCVPPDVALDRVLREHVNSAESSDTDSSVTLVLTPDIWHSTSSFRTSHWSGIGVFCALKFASDTSGAHEISECIYNS